MNDLEYNDYSLNITPNPLSMKEIIDKMDFIKMKKKISSAKDNVKRTGRYVTNWERIFAKPISDKDYQKYTKNPDN